MMEPFLRENRKVKNLPIMFNPSNIIGPTYFSSKFNMQRMKLEMIIIQ